MKEQLSRRAKSMSGGPEAASGTGAVLTEAGSVCVCVWRSGLAHPSANLTCSGHTRVALGEQVPLSLLVCKINVLRMS